MLLPSCFPPEPFPSVEILVLIYFRTPVLSSFPSLSATALNSTPNSESTNAATQTQPIRTNS